jgi:hypothetical protein
MKRLALGLLLLAPVGCLGPGLTPPADEAKSAVTPAGTTPPPICETDVTADNVHEQTDCLQKELERDLKAPLRVEPTKSE